MPTEEQRQYWRFHDLKRRGEPGSEKRRLYNLARKKVPRSSLDPERLEGLREYRRRWLDENKVRTTGEPGSERRAQYNKERREYLAGRGGAVREKRLASHREWCARNRDRQKKYYEDRKAKLPKDYNQKKHLWRSYGISLDELAALVRAQDGRCAICGLEFDFGSPLTYPHVDHSHATDEIRGVLCKRCNSGIGMLQDDPAILGAAIAYLQKTKCLSKA